MLGRATAMGALSDRAIVLIRLAAGEYGRFPELAKALFDLAPARSYDRFADFLRAKQANGEVDVEDVQIASEQFLAGLVGHLQLRKLLTDDDPSPAEIERRIELAIEKFLRGYGVPG